MKIRVILLITLSVFCFNSITAQKNNKKITITGTVINGAKEPIVNAIVMIDGQKTSSLTDIEGKYRVKVKPDASTISIFTFGHGTFEDSIKGRTRINFNFEKIAPQQLTEQDVTPGEQGVNTGYGMVKKKNLTTDIDKIDGTDKKYASYHSIGEMIQRQVAGVRVNGSTVVIQDSKNLWGSIPALIVVDGVYMDALPDINPIYVKSIEVLKGTSAAIYGSRGYGGAIVIKTKMKTD